MKIEITQRIGDIVSEYERSIPVFEKMRVDYSFGGNRSLKDACYLAGVPLEKVTELLAQAFESPVPALTLRDWREAPLEGLIDHIIERHHVYTWSRLAYLRNVSEKAALEQGIDHPELVELNWALKGTARELEAHMLKEEEIVFPHLRLLIKAQENGGRLPAEFGGFVPERKPLQVLAWEHGMICTECAEIRRLTRDFQWPVGATATVKDLYLGLKELELDLHQHTHLENNILFKRAIESGLLE